MDKRLENPHFHRGEVCTVRVKLTKEEVIWSYVGTFVTMGANVIMLPFLMYFLDADALGLWYVFTSFGAVATLFDFGFSVTFARNITYCWSGAKRLQKEDVEFAENTEPDFHMMKQVLSSCKVIYGIISTSAFLILISAGTAYIIYVSREIEGNVRVISWVIYCFGIFLNLYYGYFNSFLRGVGAVDKANKNAVISKFVQIVLTIILLVLKTGILGPCIAYLAYGTVFRQLGKRDFYRHENIKEKLETIKEKVNRNQLVHMLKIVWHNAWRDGIISFSNYFCNQASTVICSMYLPLSETGVYSIGVQIASAVSQVSGTLYNAYQPELQSSYVSGNRSKVRDTMAIIITSFTYIFVLSFIFVCVMGLPILRLVKPESVVSLPVLFGLSTYQFMLKFRNCYTSYFSCTNRIIYMKGFVVSAVLCVTLSFIAIGWLGLGVWGLIGAQIISQAVYNIWKWPTLANAELNLNIRTTFMIGNRKIKTMISRLFQK